MDKIKQVIQEWEDVLLSLRLDDAYGISIEMVENALAALREKAERENPASLTLDELRQMDGEPVYVVIEYENGFEPLTMWALVECDEDEEGMWLTNNLGGRSYYEDSLDEGMTAYRTKPKEDK